MSPGDNPVESDTFAGSGRFMIIEPTVGRTDWQGELATLCGVNLPLPPGTRTVDGFFRWSDPLPGLYYYALEAGVLRMWNKLFAAADLLDGSAPRRIQA